MKIVSVYILMMVIVGILAGIAITLVLMAIAVPQFTEYQLTLNEKADWNRIASFGSLMMNSASWIFLAVASFGIVTIIILLFLRVLNPHSVMALKRWRSVAGAKLLIVFLLSLAWLYLLLDISDSFYIMQKGMSKAIQFGIYVMGTAGLWLIAGERGWAGDFSSWRMPQNAKLVRISLLGAATGIVIFTITYLADIAAGKYFILVSEVLDRSGETSFLGFKYLALGFSIQISLELLLIADFAAALAPVQLDATEIRHRLVRPTVALAGIVALLIAAYSYAGKKYDLDKPDIASAVGIASKERNSKTVLIFTPSKMLPVTIQDWPQQTTAFSLAASGTIQLTKDNLQKVESYLNAHPCGTIYTYTARGILMNGYYALWDAHEGQFWQVKAAESQLIPRLQLLARFASMRVTPKNIELLESYSDDKKWYHSGRSARALSIAYQHFDKPVQAKAWLQKAKSLGAEIKDTKYLDVAAITQGTIKGKILLNGKPLPDVMVGLLSQQTTSNRVESYTLTEFSLARTLQDAVRTNRDGSFAFTELGGGKYLIAIMTEKNVIPFDIKPGQINVNNVPGLIQIGPAKTRNVGTVRITTITKHAQEEFQMYHRCRMINWIITTH
jgi:hypothetical protein